MSIESYRLYTPGSGMNGSGRNLSIEEFDELWVYGDNASQPLAAPEIQKIIDSSDEGTVPGQTFEWLSICLSIGIWWRLAALSGKLRQCNKLRQITMKQ